MINRLAARVRGMVSRAVVSLVNDAMKLQGVQVTLLAGQTADDAEHFQHYGLTSVPLAGAEGIALAVGGSTGHTVVINIDDRRYRLTGLANGEVALYDDLGHKVHLTRSGIVIDGAGHVVTVTNTPTLRVEADLHVTGNITGDGSMNIAGGMTGGGGMNVTGTIAATGDVTAGAISLASHKHGGVTAGGAQTGVPV
jgi:phage baseplate assembly protein V